MNETPLSEMEFELQRLAQRQIHCINAHQWPFEHLRWVELVFSLLTTLTDLDQEQVRLAVEGLDGLLLLDIEKLASDAGPDSLVTKRIVSVLAEAGFPIDDAVKGEQALRDAARSLTLHHEGKVQHYLREYGRKMIADLPDHFEFRNLPAAKVELAFTYWLQNVLNMPISLGDPSVEKFLGRFDETLPALERAADRFGLNLAVVDDLILAETEAPVNATPVAAKGVAAAEAHE